jgi:polyadenylate-binding protein
MAQPRLVKQLPEDVMDNELYDLFRPFGTLASVRTQAGFGPGTAVVEFFHEDEAQIAEETIHCSDVRGQMIAVQLYQPNRRGGGAYSEFSPNAPAFVPSHAMVPGPFSGPVSPVNKPRGVGFPTPIVHGPGQQVQLAPLVGPGSNSHSGLIDPCNLFIKVCIPKCYVMSLSHSRISPES